MKKVWLDSYEKGLLSEIDLDKYQSITEMFLHSCKQFNEKQAFYSLGQYLSFTELELLSKKFAAYLQIKLGVKPQDRVAIMLPNIMQYPIVMMAIFRIGAIIVNVNPLYTSHELNYLLANSGAITIIALENFAHTVEQAICNEQKLKDINVIITKISDIFGPLKALFVDLHLRHIKKIIPKFSLPQANTYKQALKLGDELLDGYQDVKTKSTDIAFLQYTGGTTGKSKGAILTHRNILANLEQIGDWIKHAVKIGEDIVITALPVYHIFALTANCLNFIKFGALNVLIINPRDIKSLIDDMAKFKFTIITAVNTLFAALNNNHRFGKLDFSNLHLSLGGGMAVQEAVAKKWHAITGKEIIEGYGLTEASPVVCVNPMNLTEYNGKVGLPLASTDVSIRNEKGKEVKIGESGELWVKGPQVMQGYWQQPEETAKVLTADGWLKTGDIATVDHQGYISIVDRKKDMIIVSGFNVYPNEVEDVIAHIKEVEEVAVIGIEHPEKGQIVKAYIVKKDQSLTEQDVIDHCREWLTNYKVPKIIEFKQSLPKSNVGKILRRCLK